MERASRIQLQQYTDGAQPSVDRGVQGRYTAQHDPGRNPAIGAQGIKSPRSVTMGSHSKVETEKNGSRRNV